VYGICYLCVFVCVRVCMHVCIFVQVELVYLLERTQVETPPHQQYRDGCACVCVCVRDMIIPYHPHCMLGYGMTATILPRCPVHETTIARVAPIGHPVFPVVGRPLGDLPVTIAPHY